MDATALAQMLVSAAVLVAAAYPLGALIALVYASRRAGPLERAFLRFVGSEGGTQSSRAHAGSMLAFSALAGSLVSAAVTQPIRGTLRTDTPTFAALLLAVVAITSGLTLAPALFLGPLAEGL